ncbi:MAG TPA: hypothetical protein VHV78_12945 [Gemmatimonadaceae bacterium]|jgi:hypothetical protein|nr:hypothetical protein [Gemmatimonadaceae bacterium]
MRFVYRALCAVALAGCADVKGPVETKPPSLSPQDPGQDPSDPNPHSTLDPRSLADQLEAMYGGRVAKVSIPPDAFSQFSDAVHPDIACPPADWNGARCWLLYTPYKNSDPSNENPAFLFASSDTTWVTPPQVQNPLIPYPGIQGYNSDPDHAYDPATGRLVQVYRVVSDSFNKIMMMSTRDARTWTTPVLAFQERNHDAISPALVLERDRTAKVWYVKSGTDGCVATQSTVALRTAQPDSDSRYERSTWSGAAPVQLSIPGYVVWHLDVLKISESRGYLAMIAAFQRYSNCANSDVWLASSADGVTWRTYALPLFSRSMKLAKQLGLTTWYRGTLRYDSQTDTIHFWPSGMTKTTWGVYHATAKLSDLLDLLSIAQPSDFQPPALSQSINRVPVLVP